MSPQDAARWTAVVVTYEAGDLLERCVASIRADTSAGPAQIVVVDNGSSDGSVDAVRATWPDVTVVQPGRNLGYGRAANLGFGLSRAPVVAALNADAQLHPGCAAAMLARLAEPGVGAVGPRILDPDGSVYPSARREPSFAVATGHALLGWWWPNNAFSRRYRQLDADPGTVRDVDWLSGAALWLRRDALDAVGGFDERYFMYFEDVDLAARLRAGGWRVVFDPAGELVHVQGASTDRRPLRMLAEHHRSAWRWARSRSRGPRVVLLPLVGVGLVARFVLVAAAHLLRRT